jgi:hypothetical protein
MRSRRGFQGPKLMDMQMDGEAMAVSRLRKEEACEEREVESGERREKRLKE